MPYGVNTCERDISNRRCVGMKCYCVYTKVQTQMSLNALALNPIQGDPLPKVFYSKNTVDRQSVNKIS
jgi:hypothetical protein